MINDRDALKELSSVSNINKPHLIRHYLYIPGESTGKKVADHLREQGFDVDDHVDPYDGVSWLVLAKLQMIPTEDAIAESRAFFEAIAAEYGGEYDGWEAVVQHDGS
ncbi:MAG: ribonuclease E inhibitor RraB [Veillonellaceae bacterium]|nr:ribonuclease E inhibitor RraB [Veillonellaceae bacterium]